MRRHIAALCLLFLFGIACHGAAAQSREVDPAVRAQGSAIRKELYEAMPFRGRPDISYDIIPKDGLIFQWLVRLNPSVSIAWLAEEAGIVSDDPVVVLDAWSERLNAEIVALTTRIVQEAGTDPGFNPETDVRVLVSGRVLPAERPKDAKPWDDSSYYSISFTGTRRAVQLDPVTRKPIPCADGETRGGSITCVLTPDRDVWAFRQTITGSITIRNTGTTRVPVSARWEHHIRITDRAGRRIDARGLVLQADPSPTSASSIFLEPGGVLNGRFEIGTDPLHSGYDLHPGLWTLRFADQGDNYTIDTQPAEVVVVAHDVFPVRPLGDNPDAPPGN